MQEQIVAWRKNTGLDFIELGHKDILKEAIKISPTELRQISMPQFDELMLVLSNYYIYLQSELGILIARSEYLQEAFNNAVAPRASKYGASHAGERRAIAVSRDDNLIKMQSKVRVEKTKLEMLRPINDAVRQKMYVMSKIFDRRARNEH